MIRITKHAIDRYQVRIGHKGWDPAKVSKRLLYVLRASTEMRLRPGCAEWTIFQHEMKPARYFLTGDLMMVVIEDDIFPGHHVLITVFPNTNPDRFQALSRAELANYPRPSFDLRP